MKYALVNGLRHEAQPELIGECPCCSKPMVAKCGDIKIWHWAHRGKRICDNWWENETEWHRSWKAQFPVDWQEQIHHGNSGEKHIADIKTNNNWVLEFQHSHISPDERQARNTFYGKVAWVVDGRRRKRDWTQFVEALKYRKSVITRSLIFRVSKDDCALFRDWSDCKVPVLFDFGADQALWWLFNGAKGPSFLMAVSRQSFINIHLSGSTQSFETYCTEISRIITELETQEAKPGFTNAQPARSYNRL